MTNIEAPLRVVFMGAVDEGKSTLIGKLLMHVKALKQDELELATDLTSFTDGLLTEQVEKKTIDASYRYVTLNGKSQVWIDVPGHYEYFQNAIGATSLADVAIVVINARHGLNTDLPQMTRTHLALLNTLQITNILFVINKTNEVEDLELSIAGIKAHIGPIDSAPELTHNFYTLDTLSANESELLPLVTHLTQLDGCINRIIKRVRSYKVRLMILEPKALEDIKALRFCQPRASTSIRSPFTIELSSHYTQYSSLETSLQVLHPLHTKPYKVDPILGSFTLVDEKDRVVAFGTVL